MRNKLFYSILWIFLVLLAICLVYALLIPSVGGNTIKVGYTVGNLNCAPIYIAQAEGFFSEDNVSVVSVPFSSNNELKIALSAEQIDVACSGVTNFFTPISKGVPIKIIAPMAVSHTTVYVRPDSQIKNIKDLTGKTIGLSVGGTNEYEIRRVLKKENIDASQVNFVKVDKVNRPLALMNKKIIDAVPVDYEDLAKYQSLGAVVLEEWKTKGYADGLNPDTVIVINMEFKKSNSALTERFLDDIIKGHKFIKSNPDEAANVVSSYAKKDSGNEIIYLPDNIVNIWKNEGIKYTLWYDSAIFVNMTQIAVEFGQLNSSLTLNQIFDLSYEQKLKDAQNETY